MTRKKNVAGDEADKKNNEEIIENKDINATEESGAAEVQENITDSEGVSKDKSNEQGTDKDSSGADQAEAKLAEMQDRYLRLSAEFDNYRKRTLREKIELTKHAGENILNSIVPVMDDFERALKLMETANDCTAMKSGIDLIYNKFREFLKQNGLREIEAQNNDFNVDLHEAVSKVQVEDPAMKGKVVEVVQKGYYLHEKVMRFAKVVVGE